MRIVCLVVPHFGKECVYFFGLVEYVGTLKIVPNWGNRTIVSKPVGIEFGEGVKGGFDTAFVVFGELTKI